MSILAADTFTRADQSGWGTASDGQTWANVGGPGTAAIVSNTGTLGNLNAYTIMRLGSGTAADIDAEVSLEQGPSTLNEGGISWRVADIDNNYRCVTFDNSVYINKYVAGVRSDIANAFIGFSNTDQMRMRVQHVGSALKVKFWNVSGSEPGSWNIEVTENTISAAGYYGLVSDLAGGSGSGALIYWNFEVDSAGTSVVVPFPLGNHRAIGRIC